jgi:hypothetical protein
MRSASAKEVLATFQTDADVADVSDAWGPSWLAPSPAVEVEPSNLQRLEVEPEPEPSWLETSDPSEVELDETDATATQPAEGEACDRCGSTRFVDTPIHEGRSTRRDCALCHRTWGFPRWYGVEHTAAAIAASIPGVVLGSELEGGAPRQRVLGGPHRPVWRSHDQHTVSPTRL